MGLAKKGLNYGAKQVVKRTGGGGNGRSQGGNVSLPAQVNINTTISNTNTFTENFQWTAKATWTAGSTYFSYVYMSPSDGVQSNLSSWSPMLVTAAKKYREFKVKKFTIKVSGGASTTVSGQFLFASSRDPTVPQPTGDDDFSFFERSGKLNIATPGSFSALHDDNWHAIKDFVGDEAERRLFTAGVCHIYFKVPATGFEALKLDFDCTFEFRGRNPAYSVVSADTTIMLQESVGSVQAVQYVPSSYQLRRNLTSAIRTYQLPSGGVRIRLVRMTRQAAAAADMVIRDSAGADVTGLRMLAVVVAYASAPNVTFTVGTRTAPGAALVNGKAVNVADYMIFMDALCWVAPSDYLELDNDTNVGATFQDCKYTGVTVEKLSVPDFENAGIDMGNGTVPNWVGNLPSF